jgi:hypothetical protein
MGNDTGRRIALLRGINVGGNVKVAMAELRAMAEALGFAGVKTLLQSGNLVFIDGLFNIRALFRPKRRWMLTRKCWNCAAAGDWKIT